MPGTILTFSLPHHVSMSELESKAAVLIQARARGSVARRTMSGFLSSPRGGGGGGGGSSDKAKPIMLEATPDVVAAITKVQSTFRGHQTRNEQQEAARIEWMRYYMQPEVGEYDEARSLAVSPEEEAAVERARSGSKTEEVKRQKWLKHYLASGAYAQAAELVVTPIEAATVLKAKAKAALGPWACCLGVDAEEAEAERQDRFVKAVQEYEWDVAQILASSAEEEQDVSDSKLRVQLMRQALGEGNFKQAAQYAINPSEQSEIQAAEKASTAAPRGAAAAPLI